jgi:hypothetical protein
MRPDAVNFSLGTSSEILAEQADLIAVEVVKIGWISSTKLPLKSFREKALAPQIETWLVVLGAPDQNESRAGAYYFALQGDNLRLVHTTPAVKCDVRPTPVMPGKWTNSRAARNPDTTTDFPSISIHGGRVTRDVDTT